MIDKIGKLENTVKWDVFQRNIYKTVSYWFLVFHILSIVFARWKRSG
jgi:hypothetical protein